jgi:DNA-binding MarR family transcriptional regulator
MRGSASKSDVIADIVGRLVRRHSTAIVLFHQAVAERLGIGPADHKCLDLLRERGPMTGSELAALTGLTTGAITGIVARLERAGYLHREADPHDRRKQTLRPSAEQAREIKHVFEPIRNDATVLLDQFDRHQLAAIAKFLDQTTELAYRHAALLRSDVLHREQGT